VARPRSAFDHDCVSGCILNLAMKRNILAPVIALAVLAATHRAFTQAVATSNSAQYYFVLLNRPANAPQLSNEAGEKLQEEHMGNIRKMVAEHKMLVAGPFMDDTVLRGIFVFQADSAKQVQEWANADPAVQAGRLAAEVHGPWLIDPGAIHSPSEPPGMETYTLVLWKRGEKWKTDAPALNTVLEQRPAFVKKMMAEQYLAVAGLFPLSVPGELRAVDIYRVGPEQTAKLLQEDPSVKAGLLKTEIHPWATGKGVLAQGQPLQ
jgi:uncharacterized protein